MKKFSYWFGKIEVVVSCTEEDYEWMYPLFLRNAKPFKALRDMGFDVMDKDEKQKSNSSKPQ